MPKDSIKRRDFLKVGFRAGAVASVPRVFRSAPDPRWDHTGVTWSATESLDDLFSGHNLYGGDLHAHTGYSDGYGTPSACYEYGRARRRLDFGAVSDHAEWLNAFGSSLPMADGSPVPLWANLLTEVEARYVPGAFVTFPGFEWTSDAHGHRTVVFGSTARLPQAPPSARSHPTPPDLWAALGPYVAMTIPHHVTNRPLLTVTDPEPGVAVSYQDDDLGIEETACYRALILVRQQPEANLDGDTVLRYNRRRNRFFQSSEPQIDERVWTSPVWVTRAST